jgi:hypothetical protein
MSAPPVVARALLAIAERIADGHPLGRFWRALLHGLQLRGLDQGEDQASRRFLNAAGGQR